MLEQQIRTLLGTNRDCLKVMKDVYDVYYHDTDNEREKELFEMIEDTWDRMLNDMMEIIPTTNYVWRIYNEMKEVSEKMGLGEKNTHSIFLPTQDRKWIKINEVNDIEKVERNR